MNEGEKSGVDSQAWYQLEMLRAQHCVLFEDLEQSTTRPKTEENGDEEALRERSLLTAACWQLRDNNDSSTNKHAEYHAKQDCDSALELAAVAVAADLTSMPPGLPHKISETLDWEVRKTPLDRLTSQQLAAAVAGDLA